MGRRERLDVAVVSAGLAPTRTRARSLVLAGKVLVDGHVVTKAGFPVPAGATLSLKAPDIPFVGRGGVKLAGALDALGLEVAGKVFFDIGASTGGFTQCLLERGVVRVYAVDVGYGQLDWTLRNDPRVVVHERVNARYLDRMTFPERVDGAVMDVSFISVTKILPALRPHLKSPAQVLVLVKPQFEAGPAEVGKGGVVRDEAVRQRTIARVKASAQLLGFQVADETPSPLPGAKGNLEHFLLLDWNEHTQEAPAAEPDSGQTVLGEGES